MDNDVLGKLNYFAKHCEGGLASTDKIKRTIKLITNQYSPERMKRPFYGQLTEVSFKEIASEIFYASRPSSDVENYRHPLLLLGAGASAESGAPLFVDLIDSILKDAHLPKSRWEKALAEPFLNIPEPVFKRFKENVLKQITTTPFPTYAENEFNEFDKDKQGELWINTLKKYMYDDIISKKSRRQLYSVFAKYLETHRPSLGYQELGKIAKMGYLRWIISTNFDPLVEGAFAAAQIPAHDVMIYHRKVTIPSYYSEVFEEDYSPPLLNLLKIHGDLATRRIDASSDTIRNFQEEEEASLRKSLVDLFASRDILIAGHSLQDPNINDIILDAVCHRIENDRGGFSLSFICGKPSVDNDFIGLLCSLVQIMGQGKIAYIPVTETVDSKKYIKLNKAHEKIITFDDTFHNLLTDINDLHSQRRREKREAQKVTDYQNLYQIVGMTPNKNQLREFAIGPSHNGGFNANENQIEFEQHISPIYFSSMADAATSGLFFEAISRSPVPTQFQQLRSDYPHISNVFLKHVCIRATKPEIARNLEDAMKEAGSHRAKKGIRALSPILKHLASSGSLKIMFSTKEYDLLKGQINPSAGDKATKEDTLRALQSLIFLAARPSSYIEQKNPEGVKIIHATVEVVQDEDDADIIMGFEDGHFPRQGKNKKEKYKIFKIPLQRFFPVLGDTTLLPWLLKTTPPQPNSPVRMDHDNQNSLLVTTGGPEHNKILELFIALHRWSGGDLVLDASNAFDNNADSTEKPTIRLATEDYVGGVLKRTSDAPHAGVVKSREGWEAFLVSFKIPTGNVFSLLERKNDNINKNAVQILSVIGMSAVGSILGTAYVLFSKRFRINHDGNQIDILNIPQPFSGQGGEHVTQLERDIVMPYLKYLLGEMNDDKNYKDILRGNSDVMMNLLQPVYPAFHDWLKNKGYTGLLKQSSGELHATLWAEIADEFLKT
ncbi:MAG: SIR2 family protein [Methylocystaceae bacterium]|nr:SIR2 family protein [Methylocystaceae bacterium]